MYCRCRVSRQDGVGHNAGRDMRVLALDCDRGLQLGQYSYQPRRAVTRVLEACRLHERLANDTRREEADSGFAQVLNLWRQRRQLHHIQSAV
jgi:hypothetical protein